MIELLQIAGIVTFVATAQVLWEERKWRKESGENVNADVSPPLTSQDHAKR